MSNIFLEKALEYASNKIAVFPCREKDGNPFTDKKGRLKISRAKSPYTSNGLLDSTTNPEQISEWWNRWPEACIGIDCGKSNLFVIDVDVKNGKNGINNYMSLGISDIGAWHSRTPSMGLHFVFSGSGKTSTNERTGIDTRGTGGYIIAPPSVVIGVGKYVATDKWCGRPIEITEYALEKLHCSKLVKPKNKHVLLDNNLSPEENIKRVKQALDNLPKYFYDSYQNWIEIGMSLYSLGDTGLQLWDSWSQRSSKYQEGCCEEKWDTFSIKEIGLGSLFYWAKNKEEGE